MSILLTLIFAQGLALASSQDSRELEKHLLEIKTAQQKDAMQRDQAVADVKRHMDVAQEKVLPALQTIGTEMQKLNRHFEDADLPAIAAALEAEKSRTILTSVKEVVGVADSASSILVILLIGAALGPGGLKRLIALLLDLRKGAP